MSTASGASIESALVELYRAYTKSSIYPEGHPTVPAALSAAVEGLDSAISSEGQLLVKVRPDGFSHGDAGIGDENAALRSLASILAGIDIAAVEFLPGVDGDELRAVIDTLRHARQNGLHGADVCARFDETGIEHVRLRPLRYDALRFAEGTRDSPDDAMQEGVWDRLTAAIEDPADGDDEAPGTLAHEVQAAFDRSDGAGVGVFRKRIRRLGQRLNELGDEDGERIRERLGEFLEALSPELRGDLLRVDPDIDEESVAFLETVSDVVSDEDLLSALSAVDRVQARVPDQFLILMNKLVRLSGERPDVSEGLRATLERWKVDADAVLEPRGDLREALEEVFQRRAQVDCNPVPYKALLDDLSRRRLDAEETTLVERYRDPRDRTDLRCHSTAVAVEMLAREDGQRYVPTLFAHVASNFSTLTDAGHLSVVTDAAKAAERMLADEQATEETQVAARNFLADLRSDARTRSIVQSICKADVFPASAEDLLTACGDGALAHVYDALAAGPAENVSRRLRVFVAAQNPERVAELLDRRLGGAGATLLAFFPLVRELPDDAAIPMLERLLEHPDARVKCEALQALSRADDRPDRIEQQAEVALAEQNDALTRVAVAVLRDRRTDRAFDVLARLIRGRLTTDRPAPTTIAAAVDALIAGGDAGIRRLSQALRRMSWDPRPHAVRTAALVARQVQRARPRPTLTTLLRLYQKSPGRLLASLTRLRRRKRR